MATGTVIEIPKTKSGAADPSARSFLTTIPPEIRNRVYECLFKRDGAVLLKNGRTRPDRLRERLRYLALNRADYFLDGGSEQQLKEEDFYHGFADCVGFLMSCRQVYQEAVGILYGQNTFLFSHILEDQMHFMCTWLFRIGSHYQLLSHVHIDADSLGNRLRAYDFLPLLKLIWDNPQAKCQFAFVSPESSLAEERDDDASFYGPLPPITLLNGVLFALGTADALDLRQYARHPRLMSSITIFCSGVYTPYGYVEHADPDAQHSFPHSERKFDILDHGSKVQWQEPQELSLLSLPVEFLADINVYAICPCDTMVVFDLDTKKSRGYHVGLAGVNRMLRYEINHERTRVYDEIVIQTSTQETTTDFNGFRALQEWLNVERFANLIDSECRYQERSFSIILKFRLSAPISMADLRIDISRLLTLLRCDRADPSITIRVLDGSDTKPIMWHNLARKVFLLLSDVLEQCPSQADKPLPQIWINGHGTILRATYPATATSGEMIIPYSNTIGSSANVHMEGYSKIKGLWNSAGIKSDLFPFTRNGSLIRFWYHLRISFWSDWWTYLMRVGGIGENL